MSILIHIFNTNTHFNDSIKTSAVFNEFFACSSSMICFNPWLKILWIFVYLNLPNTFLFLLLLIINDYLCFFRFFIFSKFHPKKAFALFKDVAKFLQLKKSLAHFHFVFFVKRFFCRPVRSLWDVKSVSFSLECVNRGQSYKIKFFS